MRLVDGYRRFRSACVNDKCGKYLWNIGKVLLEFTSQQPQSQSYSLPWKPEILAGYAEATCKILHRTLTVSCKCLFTDCINSGCICLYDKILILSKLQLHFVTCIDTLWVDKTYCSHTAIIWICIVLSIMVNYYLSCLVGEMDWQTDAVPDAFAHLSVRLSLWVAC